MSHNQMGSSQLSFVIIEGESEKKNSNNNNSYLGLIFFHYPDSSIGACKKKKKGKKNSKSPKIKEKFYNLKTLLTVCYAESKKKNDT